MRMLLVLPAMFLVACAARPIQPIEIEPSDICAFCRMAISEKRYAAELIDHDRSAFKFDDIGCMIHFAERHGWIEHPPLRFVHDYDSASWIEAGRARFVSSSEIPSPMASGLLAVRDTARAEQYAARFHGRVLELAELWE